MSDISEDQKAPEMLRRIVTILIGVAIIGFGIYGFASKVLRVNSVDKMTSTATGATVVDIKHHYISQDHGSDDDEYTYIVDYKDSDKIPHENVASAGKSINIKRHSKGEVVEVKYNPREPDAGCLIVGDEDLVTKEHNRMILGAVMAVGLLGMFALLKLSKAKKAEALLPGESAPSTFSKAEAGMAAKLDDSVTADAVDSAGTTAKLNDEGVDTAEE